MAQDINHSDLLAKPILEQDAFDSAFNESFEKIYYANADVILTTLKQYEVFDPGIPDAELAELIVEVGKLSVKGIPEDFFKDSRILKAVINTAKAFQPDMQNRLPQRNVTIASCLKEAAEWVSRSSALDSIKYPSQVLENPEFKSEVENELKSWCKGTTPEKLQEAVARRMPEVRYVVYTRHKVRQEFSKYADIVKLDQEDKNLLSNLEGGVLSLGEVDRKVRNFVNMNLIDKKISEINQSIIDKPFLASFLAFTGLSWDASVIKVMWENQSLQPVVLTLLSLPVIAYSGYAAKRYYDGMDKINKLIQIRSLWANEQE